MHGSKMYCAIHWIEVYLVDNTLYPPNHQDQKLIISN